MTTHSSILAWRIPWTEDPGEGPWGCKESDTTESLTHTHTHTRTVIPVSSIRMWTLHGQGLYREMLISLLPFIPYESVSPCLCVIGSLTYFKNLFYCSIVDLQCGVNFCHSAKWFRYTHTHIPSHILFHCGFHRILNIVPYTIQKDLAVYLFCV